MKSTKVAVVGAGASGLMAANLLAEKNIHVDLFEAHAIPGGCACWFRRKTIVGPCSFDVGATVVPSFTNESWWFGALKKWHLIEELGYTETKEILYNIDDHSFTLRTDSDVFFEDLSMAFPQDHNWIHGTLKKTRSQILKLRSFVESKPQWPIETPKQFFLNLQKMSRLPLGPELLLLMTPFDSWLGKQKISSQLRSWFEMNALISIQCSISEAYAMYALFAILFHSTGSGTFQGGMRTYFEALLKKFRQSTQGHYFPNTKIIALNKTANSKFQLIDSKTSVHNDYDKVLFSCPRHVSESIISQDQVQNKDLPTDLWSAFVLYMVIKDDSRLSPDAFNWHIKSTPHDEEIFASFSPKDDLTRAPLGYRCVNISHHEVLDDTWTKASPENYILRKNKIQNRMLDVFLKATKLAHPVHIEAGTPKTWQRYTNRPLGTVGGLPLSMKWTLFKTPKRLLNGPSLIQIGDTSFPGQSLYSCALSAGIAVDLID